MNRVYVSLRVKGLPVASNRIAAFCRRVLAAIGRAGWEVSIVVCDDEFMRELNGRYRGTNEATDVLSFPVEDGEPGAVGPHGALHAVGDVVISWDTLRRQARRDGRDDQEEMKRLLVHGLLHLAGMDHGRGEGGPMYELQESLVLDLKGVTLF